MSCPKGAEGPTPPKVKVNILGPQDAKKDVELQTNFVSTRCSIWGLLFLRPGCIILLKCNSICTNDFEIFLKNTS